MPTPQTINGNQRDARGFGMVSRGLVVGFALLRVRVPLSCFALQFAQGNDFIRSGLAEPLREQQFDAPPERFGTGFRRNMHLLHQMLGFDSKFPRHLNLDRRQSVPLPCLAPVLQFGEYLVLAHDYHSLAEQRNVKRQREARNTQILSSKLEQSPKSKARNELTDSGVRLAEASSAEPARELGEALTQALRVALGEALTEALGEALRVALGEALPQALGEALGVALGGAVPLKPARLLSR